MQNKGGEGKGEEKESEDKMRMASHMYLIKMLAYFT